MLSAAKHLCLRLFSQAVVMTVPYVEILRYAQDDVALSFVPANLLFS